MSTTARDEPRLFFPHLASCYASMSNLWYPLIRVTIGAILLAHGFHKLGVGINEVTGYFADHGFAAANVLEFVTIFLETVGGACIILGLFTRLFTAAIAIAHVTVHLPNGFSVLDNGIEFALLETVVMLAITFRGGGPYSLDRAIGTQF